MASLRAQSNPLPPRQSIAAGRAGQGTYNELQNNPQYACQVAAKRRHNSYFNSIGDALNHMGHQLVCLLEVLAGEQRGVVVISTEFTYNKQALGEELLAFFTAKERLGDKR